MTLALGSVYAWTSIRFSAYRYFILLLPQRLGNSLIPHGQVKAMNIV